MNGVFLLIIAAALFVASAVTASSSWSIPLLVGGIVAIAAGIYQRWWTMVTFDRPHHRHMRVTAPRERVHHRY